MQVGCDVQAYVIMPELLYAAYGDRQCRLPVNEGGTAEVIFALIVEIGAFFIIKKEKTYGNL